MNQQASTATNLANQKKAALKFVEGWPETERIKFTQEGSVSGAGYWSAHSVITIHGKEYLEYLGPHVLGGDPLPPPDARAKHASVIVIYSDGSSEVLE